MSQKYFVKNIFFFLCPMLIPLTLLGALSYTIVEHQFKQSITMNNNNLLNQMEQHIDLIFNELNSLYLDNSANSENIMNFKDFLRAETLNYEQTRALNFSLSTLTTQAIARPYIYSIYVYYDNQYKRVLTSSDGLVTLEHFYDKEWFHQFNKKDTNSNVWVQNRTIKNYNFHTPHDVITLYRNIYWSNSTKAQGIIVLNMQKNYFKTILNNLKTYQNQTIFVLDENNQFLFGNKNSPSIKNIDLNQIGNKKEDSFPLKINGESYLITKHHSSTSGWKYVSIVQTNILYKVPIILKRITISLSIISFILGILIVIYFSHKNISHLRNVISIIQSAKNGQQLLPNPNQFKDAEYQYIVENIIKSYVEQNQLKMELTEKKYQLQSAEILALQSQMNPHFLTNTLTTIYWKILALTGKPNEAVRMLEYLSDLLNFSLRIGGRTVTIEEEIRNTENYIKILQIRFKDQLSVYWDYDDTILHENILKLLFQPFIENSISHGLNKENESDSIKMKIKIRQRQDGIEVSIIDNGKGIPKERIKELYESFSHNDFSTEHIGLSNTVKRLQLTYNYKSTFRLLSKPGCGTAVIIYYPFD